MGVGPGGFYFGMKRLQSDQLFSNAHNLYLTALAEGGAAFLVAFCAFLAWALGTAWRYHPKAFAGLMAWTVYGFYSGELWEAARFASCMDFYYLLFLLACVTGAAGRGRAGGMEPAWP
jgi:O-antigen ligase